MKISVIVPIYNVEAYLRKCLDSILNQIYKDFELILVDDGSTDKSFEIADEYAANDERIVVIHKPNGGLSSARNVGLDRAIGEYICFVDSDDWIEPEYLNRLFSVASEQSADIVQCGYIETNDNGVSVHPEFKESVAMSGIDAIGRLYSDDYVETVVAWNKLYSRKIFEELRYTENIIHEDEAIIAQLLFGAPKVVFISDKLYNYRTDNALSIMGRGYGLERLDKLKAYENRMEFYLSKELYDYYQKDSFKYLYTILLNIDSIKRLQQNHNEIIKELKHKYWSKYQESLSFDWTIKRKIGMLFFGLFPRAYRLRYKPSKR